MFFFAYLRLRVMLPRTNLLQIPIFIVFDFIRPRIEPESTVSVAGAPSTLSQNRHSP